MMISSLRDYIKTCPYLDTFNSALRVNINYLDSSPDTYSIEEVPTQPIVKKYIDGSTKRQYDFVFTSREPYSSEVVQNIDNSEFYEKFANWIESQNDNEVLPVLGINLEALSIEVTSPGYAFSVSEDTAQYQIQLRLKYIKKGMI